MITGGEIAVVAFICMLCGLAIGFLIFYNFGEPKCQHEWGKIIDASEVNAAGKTTGYVVVHMCKKCGKRKVTKV